MQVWRGVAAVDPELGPTVVTIGNFDGVHRGHRHVLDSATKLAEELGGLAVVVVTFDPHPLAVLAPDKAPQALTQRDQRLQLLAAAGVDAVVVVPFTPGFAQVSPEAFVADIVLGALHARGVVVGENFRFGHRAQGDVHLLRALCADRGVTVVALPLDGTPEQRWSSSYVRSSLAEGDVAQAAQALGRLFSVRGVVVQGEQRGRALGYPTANVPVSVTSTAVPADGVYAGWLRRLDDAGGRACRDPWQPAAISVGSNPTFDGVIRQVETYVLDRNDLELYGVEVEVAFAERLRGMVKFDSVEALIDQMRADVDAARDLLTEPPGD
jgi:riboflavin kinase / FMN adenylyltransferase